MYIKNAQFFCLLIDFLSSGSFLPNGHKNFHHLSETVNIASVRQFDVKMINNLNGFDFPFKKYVPVSKYIGSIPGSEKLPVYYKTVSSRPTPTHIICRCFFQDMCLVIFLFGKIYLSIWALISVCTGRSYYVITERGHMVVFILKSKM